MLDIKLIRENVEEIIKRLGTRGGDFSYLRDVYDMDIKRRDIIVLVEKLKNDRNEKSKLIGQLKRQNQDVTHIMNEVSKAGDEVKRLDEELKILDEKIRYSLLTTPNLVHESVKVGTSEKDNKEIRVFKTPKKFAFPVKDHYQLGEELDILDFERAAKITGARFVVYKGLGARLERSLMMFMMDLHAKEHGYTEMIPPYIVNRDSMVGTGQFPKFEEDSFKLYGEADWYLNPTAEVPTINYYRDEIIDGDKLPIKFVSFTTAFRSEAGSAGRDTKGILRQHQFNKVELIKFTKPEESYQEHEMMLRNSERVLQLLDIPYRVVELCTGDMGFGMSKTYDIEVWLPGQNMYREIGSISNAEDYQARRANIRFRRTANSKTEYVHTLNGSGLAVGRTVIAVLENYQQTDGSVKIPDVLVPYMGTTIIKKNGGII
jgi:seryl-tRNA synthetase